jgi:hypothetical protein
MKCLDVLVEADNAAFDSFLRVLWGRLSQLEELTGDSWPDGIGELEGQTALVSYAVDRASKFAALRWQESQQHLEAFFVLPQDGQSRMACRIRVQAAAQATQDLAPPEWWTQLSFRSSSTPRKPLPGFMELAATLAARGNVQLPNGATTALVTSLQHEVAYFKELADDQASELRQLRAQLRDTDIRSYSSEGSVPAFVAPEPTPYADVEDLRGLPQWAHDNQTRIVVLPRALNGAKKSLYEQPAAVYRALEYLAGPYREYRRNQLSRAELDAALVAAGLKVSGSVAPSVAGEQGEAYYVSWDGRRRFLDQHLVRGGGRDERYCLRVYYFWDEASQRVVVGWLPSHLSNSLS